MSQEISIAADVVTLTRRRETAEWVEWVFPYEVIAALPPGDWNRIRHVSVALADSFGVQYLEYDSLAAREVVIRIARPSVPEGVPPPDLGRGLPALIAHVVAGRSPPEPDGHTFGA